jgi:hypothetical protein
MFLGVEISPSTETLYFLLGRKVPINLIKMIDNFSVDNMCRQPGRRIKGVFNTKEYESRRHVTLKFKMTG